MQPQKVPFQFDETEMWTPLQATALRQMNMEVPGNRIRKPDPNHRPKIDDGIDPDSNLMRSNFKAVDKWTQLKNSDGVYEVPYKFDYSFTYPDIIKVKLNLFIHFAVNTVINIGVASPKSVWRHQHRWVHCGHLRCYRMIITDLNLILPSDNYRLVGKIYTGNHSIINPHVKIESPSHSLL